MTPEEQLEQWVAGNPVHNKSKTHDECCPDFSCCKPELLAEEYERKAFQSADERVRMSMLMTFLGRFMALAIPEEKVHIAGEEGREHGIH